MKLNVYSTCPHVWTPGQVVKLNTESKYSITRAKSCHEYEVLNVYFTLLYDRKTIKMLDQSVAQLNNVKI